MNCKYCNNTFKEYLDKQNNVYIRIITSELCFINCSYNHEEHKYYITLLCKCHYDTINDKILEKCNICKEHDYYNSIKS